MNDDENKVEQAVEETVQEAQQEQVVQEQPKETAGQLNWRQLRERADRAEYDRDRYMQELESVKKKTSTPVEQDEDIHINPDDLVEGKHLSKYDKKIRKMEQELSQQQEKTRQVDAESRIRTEFPDYAKVVTEEAIYMLKTQFPELASSINANPDLYSKAKSVHQAIVKLGLTPGNSLEKELIAKNQDKPRTVTSMAPQQGDSPLTRANAFSGGLTDELKKQLYKEATDAANSR